MKRCKHNKCLSCGDMCPICGDDESKYNMEDFLQVCTPRLPTKADGEIEYRQQTADRKNKCPKCGKWLADMTSTEKDKFFNEGFCCQ
jgi:RNA polymerase subunit RPABC4/transcription elongation factor Spt4